MCVNQNHLWTLYHSRESDPSSQSPFPVPTFDSVMSPLIRFHCPVTHWLHVTTRTMKWLASIRNDIWFVSINLVPIAGLSTKDRLFFSFQSEKRNPFSHPRSHKPRASEAFKQSKVIPEAMSAPFPPSLSPLLDQTRLHSDLDSPQQTSERQKVNQPDRHQQKYETLTQYRK